MPAGVGEEHERVAIDGSLDGGALGSTAQLEERRVADAWLRRVPADRQTLGGGDAGGKEQQSRGEKREAAEDSAVDSHSGRCCRRNCSISATSSDAGGRSLSGAGAGAGDSSSASRDSSFLT